jgi:hypothetical protein
MSRSGPSHLLVPAWFRARNIIREHPSARSDDRVRVGAPHAAVRGLDAIKDPEHRSTPRWLVEGVIARARKSHIRLRQCFQRHSDRVLGAG